MNQPRITFCITCKGRTQHLRQTLKQNIEDNQGYPNARFVLLNYGSQDDLMDFLRDEVREALEDNILTVYTYENHGPFRMSHAKNMAHRLAIMDGADILVNLDADNFAGFGFAKYIAERFNERPNLYMASDKIIPGVTPRGVLGRIVVTRDQFLQVGGYDERFADWGPDDKDFNQRLRRSGYEWEAILPIFMSCVKHNDKIRFREYPHVRNSNHCEHALLAECTSTVVNWGVIGCGVVHRNFDHDHEIVLAPIPTRIFGIGMHKTGTTSLHRALELLGYNSAHWPSAHWAKRVWREMNALARSATLERFYAVSDMPIGRLFPKLDAAYPGSKFILTTRDEDAWLDSVRRHWDPQSNPFRANWDDDPFTNLIHKVTYGRIDFDPSTMLQRYRQHNADVIEHFRHRPHDLLVFNLDRNTNWRPLCSFLGRRCPPIPYPHANAIS